MRRLISCMLAKGLYSYLTQSLSIVYDTGRKNYILMLNLCHVPIDCFFFFFPQHPHSNSLLGYIYVNMQELQCMVDA